MAELPPSWMWRDSIANSLRSSLALSSFQDSIANSLRSSLALSSLAWQGSIANILQNSIATSSFAWQDNIVRSLQVLASPAWEDIVYRALNKLETPGGTEDHELATWWQALPPQVRVTTIATFVWICVFVSLVTLSLEQPDNAAIARDATGLNPVILAGGAAMLAGLVYKHFTRPDGS